MLISTIRLTVTVIRNGQTKLSIRAEILSSVYFVRDATNNKKKKKEKLHNLSYMTRISVRRIYVHKRAQTRTITWWNDNEYAHSSISTFIFLYFDPLHYQVIIIIVSVVFSRLRRLSCVWIAFTENNDVWFNSLLTRGLLENYSGETLFVARCAMSKKWCVYFIMFLHERKNIVIEKDI